MELAPSLQFLDTHSSYLSFRIKPKAGTINLTKPCRMDNNSMSWCRSLTIYSSTGATLEHIDHYNLLVNLMHKTTSPQDYRTSIGRMVDNTGSRAMRNAAMATPGGKMYNSGFDVSGILNGGNDNGRLLPLGFMQGPLTIELTLAPFADCFVGTAVSGQTAAYQIDNIEYHAQCLSFSPEYNAKFAQQLRTRGIDMSFSTYKTHNTVLTSSSIDMSISQNSASVKGVYHVLRSKDKYQSANYDSLSEYKSGNVKEVQWDMGSKLFPEYPLKLENDGIVDLYSNNLHSFNMFRNHALGSSIDDTNFWSTEAKSKAGGYNVSGDSAFKTTPVRRIYGTWVANGKEYYDKAKYGPLKTSAYAPAVALAGNTAAAIDTQINLAVNTAIDDLHGQMLEMTVATGQKNPLTGLLLGADNTVECYHCVPTLSFVPDDPRDAHQIDPSMRCKIGVAEADKPQQETTPNGNVDIQSSRAVDRGTPNFSNLDLTTLGLDRFFTTGPGNAYTVHANAVAAKNTNYEHNSKNIMYAGAPTSVAWAHTAHAGGANPIAARQVAGIGIPFVDGSGRPILSSRVAAAFKGWVEVLPEDNGFYIGCNFETFPEETGLVSGSDLTNATPLHLRL
jgi:hypothetical protein